MDKDLVKIAEKTLNMLDKKSWKSISLNNILDQSNAKKKKFENIISKQDLLKNLNKYFDFNLSLQAKLIEKSNNKDMIFEVFMMRFDILQKYRRAILSIFASFKKNPQDLIFLIPSFLESMVLVANLANIKISGLQGNIKIKGLLIIYFSSLLTWINDESLSLEKTMTSLDKNLNQAETVLAYFNK